MKSKYSALALLILISFTLSSCGHIPGVGCLINCGGGGNGTLSFVLTATPPDPIKELSIQAFTATVTGISLTGTSGVSINVPLNATTYIADFNRATSDSILLAAKVTIPAGTYNQVKVMFSAPRITFCTQSSPGTPGCAAGTLASLSGAAGSATIATTIGVSDNIETGIAVNVNIGNSLILTGQTVTNVDLTAANVFTMATLPPSSTKTDLGSGKLAHVDDVMGTITAVNSNAVTLQTATRGSITVTANSSTQFDTSCASPSVTGCIHVNDVAIIDAVLNTDGTLTLIYYQPVSGSSIDILEGVVTGVPNSNQFPIVVTDSVSASSSSLLNGQVQPGDQIVVTMSAPNPFKIIAKGLTTPPGNGFAGSTSVTAILPGQTVAFPVLTFTAQSGVTPGSATGKDLALRFSRFSVVMANSTLPIFSSTTFPSYYGLISSQNFQTTSGRLSLDGVSSLTSIANGSTFSTAALYIGPPTSPQFSALSVRAH